MKDNFTKVTVIVTMIKTIDESNDDLISTIQYDGKLNKTDSKLYARQQGLTYVSMKHEKKIFEVSTSTLLEMEV